eukprot:c13671_g1_i1 orf=1-150(-)
MLIDRKHHHRHGSSKATTCVAVGILIEFIDLMLFASASEVDSLENLTVSI